MTLDSYVPDNDLPPEHVQGAAQLRRVFLRLLELERRVDALEAAKTAHRKRLAFLEGAHNV